MINMTLALSIPSLMASTTMAFVVSGLLGHKKFAPEDIQNATLAGGVIVGATADMILQPYGAVTAGTIAGVISCLGYKVSYVSELFL